MAQGIAAIGECMIELSAESAGRWQMGFAGDTFNTLWTLRALTAADRPADYVSAFGTDPFSANQIAFFADCGIGIVASPIIAGARPGLYAITLDGAERSFTYWRSDAAARQLASDPYALAKSLENRALVYFSGITLAILDSASRRSLLQAVGDARANGALIAFDPNFRPALWPDAAQARATMTEALASVDIALPTFPDEQALYGDASPDMTTKRMADAGVDEIVVKNGDGAALVSVDGTVVSSPAERVDSPVDTTGAGDSFNGAYLAARLKGISPFDAVARAHRVAAAVIQVRGALAPVETLRFAFN